MKSESQENFQDRMDSQSKGNITKEQKKIAHERLEKIIALQKNSQKHQ
ncbi:hypothetical protein [Lapidilactobacillus luobeiensis]|nr:hypothetical protein [Lapidilactobacillus luobeiensis]